MFVKLIIVGVLLWLSFGVAVKLEQDLMMERLSGSRGGNRITLCMRGSGSGADGAGRCRGALVHPRLVVARASCLRDHDRPLYEVHMFPTNENLSCDDDNVLSSDKMRRVANRYIHPSYHTWTSKYDLALVAINRPYTMDTIEYSNNTYSLLQEFDPWVYHIMKLYQPIHTIEPQRTSPEKLFLMAVILPFILFILFFMYVTSGTTQHNKGQTVY